MIVRALLIVLLFHSLAPAATPMDAALPENEITEITVDYAGGTIGRGDTRLELPAGTFHYKVYVPKGYAADPKLKFPAVFISSPNGNATLGEMERRVKANGWIAIMLVEAQKGPWEPTVSNFLAAHDDTMKRLRIADGFKVATGQSEGALAASRFVGLRSGFGALVLQNSPWWSATPSSQYETEGLRTNPRLAVWLAVSDRGLKKGEQEKMERALRGANFTVEEYLGSRMPREAVEAVFDQVERHLYTDGPRSDDTAMYVTFFHRLRERAATLGGEPIAERATLDLALDLARKRTIETETSVAEHLPKMRERLAALDKDERVKSETVAKTAFQKLRIAEIELREKFNRRLQRAQPMLRELARSYKALADKYGATSYGQKTHLRFETLSNELDQMKKDEEEPRKRE